MSSSVTLQQMRHFAIRLSLCQADTCAADTADHTPLLSILQSHASHKLGSSMQVNELTIAAEEHANVLEENKRLYNEVLDLKGNIRVFCRLRPAGATGDASQRKPARSKCMIAPQPGCWP